MVCSWLLLGGVTGWITVLLKNSNKLEYSSRPLVGVGVLGGLIGGYAGISIIPGTGLDAFFGSMMLAVCIAIGAVKAFISHISVEGNSAQLSRKFRSINDDIKNRMNKTYAHANQSTESEKDRHF